jgi:Autographiviridae RNA polymerase
MEESSIMDGIDVERALERFEKRERKRFKRAGFGGTKEFAALDRAWRLVDRLAAYIPTQLQKPTQLNLLLRDLVDRDPRELALVVVASVAHSAVYGREDPEMTIDIGKAVQDLAFETKVLRPEKKSRGHLSAFHCRQGAGKVARVAMEARYRSKEWLIENEVQAGNLLLDFCLSALPDIFQLVPRQAVKAVRVPDEKVDEAVEIYARQIAARPVFTPRTSPPKPWSGWRTRGYQAERERASTTFVTGAAALQQPSMQGRLSQFQAVLRAGKPPCATLGAKSSKCRKKCPFYGP